MESRVRTTHSQRRRQTLQSWILDGIREIVQRPLKILNHANHIQLPLKFCSSLANAFYSGIRNSTKVSRTSIRRGNSSKAVDLQLASNDAQHKLKFHATATLDSGSRLQPNWLNSIYRMHPMQGTGAGRMGERKGQYIRCKTWLIYKTVFA
jgi:hypothetical protein